MTQAKKLYCAQCGQDSFGLLRGNEYRCNHCDFSYFHNVASAVSAIIRYNEAVLFTVRAKDPGIGLLDLPGGFVDPNESMEQALAREIDEELGIVVSSMSYLYSHPNTYRFNNVSYFTLDACFEIILNSSPKINHDQAEIAGWKWLALDKVDTQQVAFHSTKQTLLRYLKSPTNSR